MSDTDELRYTTLNGSEGPLAGIMDASGFLPERVPSHWSVYFGVDDADAAVAKTVALGGSIVQPAQDTPYGRLARATDVTGAHFNLMAPNEAMPARPTTS
jgi:predicted enzyme related to lactoylglutathione lyase